MINLDTTTRTHLRIDEFAELIGKRRRMVYYYVKQGKLHTEVTWAGTRIPIAEARRVIKLLEDQGADLPCLTDSVQLNCKTA